MKASRAFVVVGFLAACSEPKWEWPVGTPADQGMDAATLEGARTYAFQDGKHTQGVVVTRRGTLVAEWYEDGRGPDSYAASWSMAKSFTSALVGIAIHDGKIPSVDVPMVNYYPEWAGSERDQIRLEDVLHMQSGLMWNEDYDVSHANESDVVKLVFTLESPLAYVVSRPAERPANTFWEYSSGDSLLLSGMLQQATGKNVGDYAKEKLFSKMDMDSAEWWRAKTGETLTYCCLDMTSRDFARFGLLYMDQGVWDGDQIVPKDWISKSLQPSLARNYGYQWWMEGLVDQGLPIDLYMANGHDGQFIYIVPSLQLVVVRNGHYDKYDGPPVADPSLFIRYPSDGLTPEGGTIPPDSWSHAEFMKPIIDSIID